MIFYLVTRDALIAFVVTVVALEIGNSFAIIGSMLLIALIASKIIEDIVIMAELKKMIKRGDFKHDHEEKEK